MKLKRDAYTASALVEAGLDPALVARLLVDGPRAVPERPRLSLTGRKRGAPTTTYVWGPDADVLLKESR